MKRKLTILCILTLITFTFAGCNEISTSSTTSTATTEVNTTLSTPTTEVNTTSSTTSPTTTTTTETTIETSTELVDYTLTFESNQGTVVSPIVEQSGVNIILPIPTRTDYFFTGWFIDALFTFPFQEGIMPSENMTLYAKWMNASDVLSFISNADANTQFSMDYERTMNRDGVEESHGLMVYQRNEDSIRISNVDQSPLYISESTAYIVKIEDDYMSFSKEDCEESSVCWSRDQATELDVLSFQSYYLGRMTMFMPETMDLSWFDIVGQKMILKSDYFDEVAAAIRLGSDMIISSIEIDMFLYGVGLTIITEYLDDDRESILTFRIYDIGTTSFDVPIFDVCTEDLYDWDYIDDPLISAPAIEITGYYGDPDEIVIPERISNRPVIKIAENAFNGYTTLKSVVLPQYITHIGDGAFANCPNLESVTLLGYTPPELGVAVFSGASSSLIITVPNSSLPAYQAATNWSNISTQLVAGATYTVTYDPNGGTFVSGSEVQIIDEGEDAVPPIYERAGYYLYWNLVSTDIMNDVTITAQWSDTPITSEGLIFTLKSDDTYEVTGYTGTDLIISLQEVYNGKAVTSIGNSAFGGKDITKLTMPDSITSIEERAFMDCTQLVEIILSTNLTFIGKQAFSDCQSLVSIDIPNLVTDIADHTFMRCYDLTTISLPSSLLSIGESVFWDCRSLVEIEIPENLISIGDEAFGRCPALTAINVDPLNTVYSSVDGVLYDITGTSLLRYPAGKQGMAVFGADVTKIGSFAFGGYSASTISIPNTVTAIDERAFSDNDQLRAIYIPATVTEINDHAFIGVYNATIFYEGAQIPTTWSTDWNTYDLPVILNEAFPTTYTITYVTNGGNAISPLTQDINSVPVTLEVPVRAGYTFLGWNTRADGEGSYYVDGTPFQRTAKLKLFGIWELID